MDLSDKIKQILVIKSISPSIFADEIGIQRSSMSHILAGRNKPSLEMVQKIVKRFPDLGLEWILDENELPTISAEQQPIEVKKAPVASKANIASPVREPKQPTQAAEKVVDKIVVFYSDGTFREYRQG